MNRQKTNIFIAQTPLQNFIAAKIVEQFFSDKDNSNALYTSVAMEDTSNFDTYYLIEKNSPLKKVQSTYSAKKKISKSLKASNGRLFMPHTGALLGNYFFYSFPRKKYGVLLNFYYEGILYFYEYNEPYRPKIHLSRKLFALLMGFIYKRNPQIFPQNSSEINKIYSILPEFTIGPPEKMVKVSLFKESYVAKENCALIVGGKPSLLENEEVIALYQQMIEKIRESNKEMKVYFKGHHADQSSNFSRANDGKIKVEDITQNSPIEEVIEVYKPGLVLSYPSSALVNLKAMYGSKIELSSYYIDKKKHHLAKLWPIFEKLHIHLKLI